MFYVRGKIEDCIVVNDVEVIHHLYDEWFENELQKFGININTTYHVTPKDCLDKRWYHRFSMFKWEEKLKVTYRGKGCCINRNNRVEFNTNMAGMLLSSSDDIVSIKFDESKERSTSSVDMVTKEKPSTKKIQFKEAVNLSVKPSENGTLKKASPKSSYTQHKGFEENDIF